MITQFEIFASIVSILSFVMGYLVWKNELNKIHLGKEKKFDSKPFRFKIIDFLEHQSTENKPIFYLSFIILILLGVSLKDWSSFNKTSNSLKQMNINSSYPIPYQKLDSSKPIPQNSLIDSSIQGFGAIAMAQLSLDEIDSIIKRNKLSLIRGYTHSQKTPYGVNSIDLPNRTNIETSSTRRSREIKIRRIANYLVAIDSISQLLSKESAGISNSPNLEVREPNSFKYLYDQKIQLQSKINTIDSSYVYNNDILILYSIMDSTNIDSMIISGNVFLMKKNDLGAFLDANLILKSVSGKVLRKHNILTDSFGEFIFNIPKISLGQGFLLRIFLEIKGKDLPDKHSFKIYSKREG